MEDNTPYLRVGTRYYKRIKTELASEDTISSIIPWDRASIKEDHSEKDYISRIVKYDSFCLIPSNTNYKRVHGEIGNGLNGNYNLYDPPIYVPEKGKFEKTERFLKHIFNEQYEIGLDYLTIIYRFPTQILPILCLVSSERKTGKTTFLNWLKMYYGANMTINTNDDFRNQFNSGWTSKLIIGVDEVMLDKKEDAEKIKNLSTTRSIKSEAKGKDKVEAEFFGKFILCSNNEDSFIKIPPEEIRFWVRKIPSIEKEDYDLLKELKKEIPAFLFFLANRSIINSKSTRMWFTKEQIYTDALLQVIRGSLPKLDLEIKEIIREEIIKYDLDELKLTPKNIMEKLAFNNVRATKTDIISTLKSWGKNPCSKVQKYSYYHENGDKTKETGRCYTFNKYDYL